ncbi:MAG: helix-turn-helix domain-containing protein [Lachnospiraceae bacterium]|nr:helix-turn-helix domain-containing protein [Lachnospiraceae bacterium]
MSEQINVPVAEKAMLTVRECAAYSNLGIHKLQALCSQPDCTFSVKSGNRFLIKRQEFDEWLRGIKEI